MPNLKVNLSIENSETDKKYSSRDFGQIPEEGFFEGVELKDIKENHDNYLLLYLIYCWSIFEMAFFAGSPPAEIIKKSREKIVKGFKKQEKSLK